MLGFEPQTYRPLCGWWTTWVSLGFNSRDFNIIVHPSKSSSYNGFQGLTSEVKEFFECIHQIAIFDHAYIGLLFTWSNRQWEGFVAKKLDRALINAQWLLSFPSSKMEFLSHDASNHCLVVVQLSHQTYSLPRSFKFFNFWAKHAGFFWHPYDCITEKAQAFEG